MQKHYQTVGTLIQKTDVEPFDTKESFPLTDDVSYGSKAEPFTLGFDYGAGTSDEERGYFYGLCYFMSVGKRKDFGTHTNKSYIVYDGIEEWALFVNEERDANVESVSVNEYGYRELPELSLFKKRKSFFKKLNPFIQELTKLDRVIHDELKRLHLLWHEETK